MRTRKTPWLIIGLAAALIVAALGAAACGDDDSVGDEASGDIREVRVTSTDDPRFEPSEIRLKVGEPVRLVMENMGAAVHDFTIDEMPMTDGGSSGAPHDMGDGTGMGEDQPAIHLAVESHRDGTMEFTPTERGSYTFYCSVEGHRDGGMQGTMIVE